MELQSTKQKDMVIVIMSCVGSLLIHILTNGRFIVMNHPDLGANAHPYLGANAQLLRSKFGWFSESWISNVFHRWV